MSADPPNHYQFEAGDTSPVEEARAEGGRNDETMLPSPGRRHSNTGDGPPNISEQLSPWYANTDPNRPLEQNAAPDRPDIDSSSFLESTYEEPLSGAVDGGDVENQMDREWETHYHAEGGMADRAW